MMKLLRNPNSQKKLPDKEELRLLAVQIAGIGDLVLATPAFDAIKDKFPNCRLDLVTTPRSTSLLQNHPSISEIYAFDISTYRKPQNLIKAENRKNLRNELKPLVDNNYDVILSLNNISSQKGGITLGLLFKAIGAPIWAGRNTDGLGNYFDYSFNENSRDIIPEALTKLKTAALLGSSASPRPLSMHLNTNDQEEAESIVGDKDKTIALLPGVNDPTRAWPMENFAEVGRLLADDGYQIVVIGGPAESDMGEKIRETVGSSRCFSLAGKCKLGVSLGVLKLVNLVVANNTGPMHMAAAVGTPIIAVFDPLHQNRYRPWTPDNYSSIIYHSDPEIKDFDILFSDLPKYIRKVKVEEVVESCRKMLNYHNEKGDRLKEYTTPEGLYREDRETGKYVLVK